MITKKIKEIEKRRLLGQCKKCHKLIHNRDGLCTICQLKVDYYNLGQKELKSEIEKEINEYKKKEWTNFYISSLLEELKQKLLGEEK